MTRRSPSPENTESRLQYRAAIRRSSDCTSATIAACASVVSLPESSRGIGGSVLMPPL